MMRATTLGLGLLLTVCAVAARAQNARVPVLVPPDPEAFGVELALVAPTVPIPSNGAILLRFVLHGDPTGREQRPLLQVSKMVEATATTYPGTLRELGSGYWAWTATTPLEPGDYQVAYAHPEWGAQSVIMTVVAETPLELPEFTSVSFTTWQFEVTEQGACLFGDGLSGFSPGPAFPIRERGLLMLQSNLTFTGDSVASSQFLFRALTTALDAGPLRDAMMPLLAGPFASLDGEHCARVEALEIATGTVHTYPDELCATGEVVEDHREERVVLRDEQLNRFDCPRPGPGLEALWCELNDQCIDIWRNEEIIFVNNCQSYFEYCPDAEPPDAGMLPEAMDGGRDAGVVGPDGGTSPGGGSAPPPGDAGSDTSASGGKGDSGCSIALRPRSAAGPFFVLLLAGVSLVLARRRVRASS